MKQYPQLPAAKARSLGYMPLTTGYCPHEYGMLQRVIDDMRRGESSFVLVIERESEPQTLAVYKKGNENGTTSN